MGRDYKNRGGTRRTKKTQAPGWLWLLAGLAIGLSVAAGVHVYDRATLTGSMPVAATHSRPASAAAEAEAPEEVPDAPKSRFEFYNMLPSFEVIIPEREPVVSPSNRSEPVAAPGAYVLQAGSFQRYADAERRKASLALLGVVARIQKVTIDNEQVWHRVRIGPITDLNELNETRRSLASDKIEFLMIRVGG